MQIIKKILETIKAKPAGSRTSGQSNYQEAKDWYQEKYELITVSRNRYRLLSVGLGGLLGLSMGAIITLMPLKQYVYRLIEVNQQTGEVNELKEMEGKKYSSDWVVTRYFLHQYILNRHLYHHEDIKRTFNLALSMSDKSVADILTDATLDTNPDSPLNKLGKSYYRDVTVLGINQLSDNTALVRFKTITKNDSNKTDVKEENLQAVIKWEYASHPATMKDRDQNPLGFYVTYYQESPVYAENN